MTPQSDNTNKVVRLHVHPMGGYVILIGAFVVFSIIGIPLLSRGHSGGEQVPFTLLAHALNVLVFGLILWSIASPILFWRWYKKHNFIPLIIPVCIVILLTWMIITIYLRNDHYFAF